MFPNHRMENWCVIEYHGDTVNCVYGPYENSYEAWDARDRLELEAKAQDGWRVNTKYQVKKLNG
jgi:hypothetical protein